MNMAMTSDQRLLPGGVGLWIFIVSDLLLFALFFVLFSLDLSRQPELFEQGRLSLSGELGLLNTLLLLSGSWAVVMATHIVKTPEQAQRYLRLGSLSGGLFLIVKTMEYSHLISAGHSIADSSFYSWYFILTAYHACHVIAGIIFLEVLASRIKADETVSRDFVEASGCYWHLVDLLWIGIFSFVYLISL